MTAKDTGSRNRYDVNAIASEKFPPVPPGAAECLYGAFGLFCACGFREQGNEGIALRICFNEQGSAARCYDPRTRTSIIRRFSFAFSINAM
jgi:hypothetical protein